MGVLYLLISFSASVVGAISGIGGGVIIKPILDTLGSYDVAAISFLSGNTVLAMTIVALARRGRSGPVLEVRAASVLAGGGVIGGLAGRVIFDLARGGLGDLAVVGAIQSAILAVLAAAVLLFTIRKERIRPLHRSSIVAYLVTGLLLGAVASFLGIGGGPINLAVLYLVFGFPAKRAALYSIYIILFSQAANLGLTIVTGSVPDVPLSILAYMIAGGVAGGLLGAQLSRAMTDRGVDILFGGVMVAIIGVSILNVARFAL